MTDNFKNPIASTDDGVTSLASIITQVDRDGNPSTTEKLTVQSTQYNNTVVPSNNNSRYKASYMFELFFSCCSAKSDVVDNQSSVSVNNIELSVAALQSSPTVIQSQKYHNNLNNNNSSVGVHGLPVKMPEMGYPDKSGKKCLVLDLDETLVHSSFQPVPQANYVIPVNIDGTIHNVYVIKRPGVDSFMHQVSEFYEIVIYTASLSKYADPLLDKLDVHKVIKKRLFRENCVLHDGHYVKDLSLLNRDIKNTIIVDNSPASYKFHPENAIDCSSFFDDPNDTELWVIGKFLTTIRNCDDVRAFCRSWKTYNG